MQKVAKPNGVKKEGLKGKFCVRCKMDVKGLAKRSTIKGKFVAKRIDSKMDVNRLKFNCITVKYNGTRQSIYVMLNKYNK